MISWLLYAQMPNVELSNHFKGFCKIRGRQRPPDTPSWAWFLGTETSSSSNLRLTTEFHSVWICDNSLQNCFTSVAGTGDPRVSGLQLQWSRWRPSEMMMGLQSLRWELRAGHFRSCPPAKAGLDPFKTQVWEQSCPRICWTFSQIGPSSIIITIIIIVITVIIITITITIIIIMTIITVL